MLRVLIGLVNTEKNEDLMIRAKIGCLLLVILTSACASLDEPLNIGPESPIVASDDQGLVAVRFISNYDGNVKAYKSALSFAAKHKGNLMIHSVFTMRDNNDPQFRVMKPGKYTFDSVFMQGEGALELDSKKSTFEVFPGKITYIGDITFKLSPVRDQKYITTVIEIEKLGVESNAIETVAELLKAHPEIDKDKEVMVSLATLVLED